MDRNRIENLFLDTIREVQEMSGVEPTVIDLQTCPIMDLKQFDSLTGVEATHLLAGKLKCAFKCGRDDINVFVSKVGRRPLKICEIVDRLVELVEEQ